MSSSTFLLKLQDVSSVAHWSNYLLGLNCLWFNSWCWTIYFWTTCLSIRIESRAGAKHQISAKWSAQSLLDQIVPWDSEADENDDTQPKRHVVWKEDWDPNYGYDKDLVDMFTEDANSDIKSNGLACVLWSGEENVYVISIILLIVSHSSLAKMSYLSEISCSLNTTVLINSGVQKT